jgi:signal transduction histidine kinase
VFEKYYRAPLAQRRPGTGLGLYLVLHLTALLGGRVQYRPQAPWLRFEVLLPLTPAWAGDQRQAA